MVSIQLQFETNSPSSINKLTGLLSEAVGKAKKNIIYSLNIVKKTGENDPRRIVHSLKVGLALTIASLSYYINPLYKSFGVNAMWAVLTVVVVMEYTVGGTLGKGLNRAIGTLVAGALGLGAHYLAVLSGPKGEPIIIGIMVFVLGAAATFSRFLPEIKARFDYGATIFILTFSLVAISGYRVEEFIELAHQRLSTIAIGGAVCISISIFIFPVWAGEDFHKLIVENLESLAAYLEGLSVEHFGAKMEDSEEESRCWLHVHEAVLNSKATEETLANLARWEPGHNRFGFRHPWKLYLKVGAQARRCAYYIEALNAQIAGSREVGFPQDEIRTACANLCSESAHVFKELAFRVRTMSQPSAAPVNDLKSSVKGNGAAMEAIQAAPVVSLLSQIVCCTRDVALSVEELAKGAKFRRVDEEYHHKASVQPITEDEDAYRVIDIRPQEER